jgi:aminopeptidase N
VKLSFPYNRDQLMFLMQHDSDGFNRWDAGQQLSVQVLQELIAQQQKGESLVLDPRLISALKTVLSDESLDQAMVAEMLSLPSEAYLTEISEVADVEAIHNAREFARKQLADNLFGRGRALRPSCAAEHCAVVPDAQRQAGSTGRYS